MKRLKEIVLSVVCFLFFSNFSFSGVKFYGEVKDPITNNLISGVNVKLIGPNLQTTTTTPYQDFEGRNINFEINDVPRNSIFMIQCSKSGYVNTILPGGVGNSDTYISIPIISQSFYTNNIHGGTAPSHQSGKADIAGSVEGPFGPVSGVVISAKYIDNGQTIPSSQIRYLGDNFIPGNYNSTQNNGFFCIYNVEPKRPILITGTKTGFKFNQIITLGYPDSLTIGGIESIENYVSIQGKVIDINENPVSGANISIVGTNISTVSSSDGSFTLINVPPDSLLISKVSKSGYKDVYQNLYVESEQIECIAVSSNFYNQILLQIGQSHIQGKGDIGGSVGNIEGVVVKLYDYQGNEVNVKVYYMDENGQFNPNLISTSSEGGFLIINLEPGPYFIKGEKQGIEFPVGVIVVFSDGISIYESEVELPELYIWAGDEIQVLPDKIGSADKNVHMLRFNLWKGGRGDDIIITKIVFTSKGTGNISNSVSSAKLYETSDWINFELVKEGSISKNKIIFDNFYLRITETGNPAKYLSLVFDFNGNANQGETFGVDILKSDITAIGYGTFDRVIISGLPVYGRMTTITGTTTFEFVIEPLGLTIPEGESQNLFIHLSAQPSENVIVNIEVTGDSDISVSPTTITFTPENWNKDQIITVSAAKDSDAINGTATIIISAEGFRTAYIPVVEQDNDVVKGDINGDGEIDIRDVILCLRMAIGLDPVSLETADMNNDGEIDIRDVILVLRKAIGLD